MGSLLLALIYLCFISLGLPDSLLGSAWPVLHKEINVSVSMAGVVSMTICAGTILSSLLSEKLLRKFGAGLVTAVSCAMTAVGLLSFSISNSFPMLILSSVPYGLGAGAVDAILNNYVALHYKAQHMSWLHCMWGVGASISPCIMSYSLVSLNNWSYGYLIVCIIQFIISAVIFFSIPLWKGEASEPSCCVEASYTPIRFKEIISTKRAIPCFITFFAYCALEVTTSLWASSYLVDKWNFTPETAAGLASLFYIGVTLGRFANGFLAMRLSDHYLIRMGIGLIGTGIALLFMSLYSVLTLIGFVIIGLGCAPIYPCIIHMTPTVFGEEKSQAMIGIQMAFAYSGFLFAPTIFGFIADYISISSLPVFQLILLILMLVMHEFVVRKDCK